MATDASMIHGDSYVPDRRRPRLSKGVRIERTVAAKAEMVAARRGISLTSYATSALRDVVERDWAKIDPGGERDPGPPRQHTMNGLQVFTFETQDVRVVAGADGEPWWVAIDVCRVLGISNSRDALARLDEDEKGVATTDTLGGPQELAIINESGLYSLVLTSRKPQAKRFKKWVTSEVLPAIRKTGQYSIKPMTGIKPMTDLEQWESYVRYLKQVEAQGRRLEIAEARIDQIAARADAALVKAEAAIVTLNGDTGYVSILGYCSMHYIELSQSEMAAIGARLSRICRDQGIEVKRVHSERFGEVNAYPVHILDRWRDSLSSGIAAKGGN